ncbi:hypothetical protein BAMA111019_10915 [Bacillus manliponensis]
MDQALTDMILNLIYMLSISLVSLILLAFVTNYYVNKKVASLRNK